ncbi:MAG: alpha/beta hydrolase, partial [Burkholderiales bacterium]|nr:alpha/beta hydrolase [Burkholderiales bacterium]
MDVMEQILQFGPDHSLVGVLTSPVDVKKHAHPAVAYILFNSGVISRVGPHRNNVRLARAMAESGEWVLRFDLSGHGDSRPAAGNLNLREQAVADLKSAM